MVCSENCAISPNDFTTALTRRSGRLVGLSSARILTAKCQTHTCCRSFGEPLMRFIIRSSARPSHLHRHRAPLFMSRHLTLWFVLVILAALVVLSSVLAGERAESRKSAAAGGRKQVTKSVADVLSQQGEAMQREWSDHIEPA